MSCLKPSNAEYFHISVGLTKLYSQRQENVGQACKICVRSLLSLFFPVVVNVVEEEKGTILPILYECLICIQLFILTF